MAAGISGAPRTWSGGPICEKSPSTTSTARAQWGQSLDTEPRSGGSDRVPGQPPSHGQWLVELTCGASSPLTFFTPSPLSHSPSPSAMAPSTRSKGKAAATQAKKRLAEDSDVESHGHDSSAESEVEKKKGQLTLSLSHHDRLTLVSVARKRPTKRAKTTVAVKASGAGKKKRGGKLGALPNMPLDILEEVSAHGRSYDSGCSYALLEDIFLP